MDASYKIQRGIHVHLIQFFMCPEFWVHIIRILRFTGFLQSLCGMFHYSQFFFVHGIEHDINLFSTGTLSIKLVRKKELIHGNLQQGDELIESIKAGVLPPVLDIHDGAWGAVHELG